VSALDEPHNTHLTKEKDNRKRNSRKIETAVPPEWKRHKTKSLRNAGHTYRTFKSGTDIPEQKTASFWGHMSNEMFFRVI
jgi:hypothetical protein